MQTITRRLYNIMRFRKVTGILFLFISFPLSEYFEALLCTVTLFYYIKKSKFLQRNYTKYTKSNRIRKKYIFHGVRVRNEKIRHHPLKIMDSISVRLRLN